MRRTVVVAASLTALALAVSGCSGSSSKGSKSTSSGSKGSASSSSRATGGTLSLGTVQAPTSFVPGDMNATGPVPQMYQPVYDTLINLNSNADPTTTGLATSFSYNSTQTVLTLKLRSGVKFTDGTTLDATAVKANLDKAEKGTGESGSQLKPIKAVTVVDANTVKIGLTAPDPSLVRDLGGSAGMMASPKLLNSNSLKTTPVGSGPYVFDAADSTTSSKYAYTRNASWWGDKNTYPYNKLVITVFNDNAAQLNALRSGQINGAVIGQKDVTAAKGSGLTVTTFSQYTSSGLYIFDRKGKLTPALGKLQVRQAINYAIDRVAFLKNTQANTGVATDQLFNSLSGAYDPALNSRYTYDLAKAKQLMAAAGYPNGFTVKMPDSSPIYPQEQAAITEALKAINIKITYLPVNGQTFIGNILGGKYSMALFQLNTGVEWDVVTEALQPGSLWNTFHVADPTIDGLITKAQSQTGAAATATYKKINAAVVEAGWFAILNQPSQFYATTSKVTVTPQKYANNPPISGYAPKG